MTTLHGQRKRAVFDPEPYREQLVPLLKKLATSAEFDQESYHKLLKQHPKDGTGYFSKTQLLSGYKAFAGRAGIPAFDQAVVARLQMKPVRTHSGVTPVTVLTKPFPCPGKCIFCPNDVRMPKSYLSNEPGAQRAERNHFHPYLQTYNRLLAYQEMGHSIAKVELIVLGGTWSIYPLPYKLWFVASMFAALNDMSEGIDRRADMLPSLDVGDIANVHEGLISNNSYNETVSKLYKDQELAKLTAETEQASWKDVEREHARNQSSEVKCVGLVLETRPDHISEQEVMDLRRMGATKTQIGLQSLQDHVLEVNKRGHDVAASRRAIRLLRQAGMKIHAHWMPNLYGSNVEHDIEDYRTLFADPDFCPDELKIYPCSLIEKTELMDVYESGDWQPYTQEELLEVLAYTMTHTPSYCRLTRVIRDIPSDDIVAGNTLTNFRQIAADSVRSSRAMMWDIRAREIRRRKVKREDLVLTLSAYETSSAYEYFLEYVTDSYDIAGFLRLSLPKHGSYIDELGDQAIIREVHVYGEALDIGASKKGKAQHLGLGKSLVQEAATIARDAGYTSLAVISAIGTRAYYAKQGFEQGELYQHLNLVASSQ